MPSNILPIQGQESFTIEGFEFRFTETLDTDNAIITLSVNEDSQWNALRGEIIFDRATLNVPQEVQVALDMFNAAIQDYLELQDAIDPSDNTGGHLPDGLTFLQQHEWYYENRVAVIGGRLTLTN